MAARRRPTTVVIGLLVLLGGAWISLQMARGHRDDAWRRYADRLPDAELHDLSLAELEESMGRPWAGAPPSAEHISLRIRAQSIEHGPDDVEQRLIKFLRLRLDPSDLTRDRYPMMARLERRRPLGDRPPAWWQVEGADPGWGRPTWFRPGAGRAVCSWNQLPDGRWLGEYLHYDPSGGWLHYWEFWRRDVAPSRPPLQHAVADLLAQDLARVLVREGEVGTEGWLHVQGRGRDALGVASEHLPAGLTSVDALLLPLAGRGTYLLALHGLSQAEAEALLADLPMWPLPADGPPPVADWQHALPGVAGERRLPSWFQAGAGPRWGYSLLRPPDGRVERGRWAAYDRASGTLLAWDWDSPDSLPATADILAGVAPPAPAPAGPPASAAP